MTGRLFLLGLLCSVEALAATQIPEEVTKVRDPFKRPVARFSREKPRSPLELYPVEKFKLVGIITGPRKLRAMVLGPDGKSYFVAEGTPIGVRKGLVRKITHDTVHVRERVLNVLGQEENVDSEMKLPEEGRDLGLINAPLPEPKNNNVGNNQGGGNGGLGVSAPQNGGGQPSAPRPVNPPGGAPAHQGNPNAVLPAGVGGTPGNFGAEPPVGSGGSIRPGGSG